MEAFVIACAVPLLIVGLFSALAFRVASAGERAWNPLWLGFAAAAAQGCMVLPVGLAADKVHGVFHPTDDWTDIVSAGALAITVISAPVSGICVAFVASWIEKQRRARLFASASNAGINAPVTSPE